jgi:hypothetical protein
MPRLTKSQWAALDAANSCRLRKLDGCAFRGAAKRTAEFLVKGGLLQFVGWGLVDDSDFDSDQEYAIWSITEAGEAALEDAEADLSKPPRKGTKRYKKVTAAGCGLVHSYEGEPDCSHKYGWVCEDCPMQDAFAQEGVGAKA